MTTTAVPITYGFVSTCFKIGKSSEIFIFFYRLIECRFLQIKKMNLIELFSLNFYNCNMIGIIDYNAGNITSVARALKFLNAEFTLSKKPADLEKCDKIIFPGVGDAAYAMEQLKKTGFDTFIKDFVKSGKKLAGFCLGAQIIFDFSEEGNTDCLGLIPGKIRHFKNLWKEEDKNLDEKLKCPHMGWNDLSYTNGGSSLFEKIPEHSDFYFVHSYVICPEDKSVIKATCDYGVRVPSCIEKDNITVFQFHPEKSGERGLQILKNFAGE